jgi:hypothetical protein
MALEGWGPEYIAHHIPRLYGPRYRLDLTTDRIRPNYRFMVLAQNSAPPALRCAIEGADWEPSVRLCVSLGGDADTMAAMAGGVAEGFMRAKGIASPLTDAEETFVRSLLAPDLLEILDAFRARFAGAAFAKSSIAELREMPDPGEDDE